jgi:hypothetical protein
MMVKGQPQPHIKRKLVIYYLLFIYLLKWTISIYALSVLWTYVFKYKVLPVIQMNKFFNELDIEI